MATTLNKTFVASQLRSVFQNKWRFWDQPNLHNQGSDISLKSLFIWKREAAVRRSPVHFNYLLSYAD
jgi:hypothetical protein